VVTSWVDEGFIAFDTETTGLDIADSRIVTAAAIHFVAGVPAETRTWLIRVDVEIPSAASDIHGVTTAMSQADGMDAGLALGEIRAFLNDAGLPVVCFKSDFDIPMLNANLMRNGLQALPSESSICALVIDKHCNKYVRGSAQRRLKPTAARYGIELSEDDWHGAEADALAAGRIFMAEVQAYPQLTAIDAVELSSAVEAWREEQEIDYQRWRASQPPRT
jgi:DNA polymerase-3 subunit epsilon